MDISDLTNTASLQSLVAPQSTTATPTPPAPGSATSPGSTSPAVQAASLLESSDSVLFASLGGGSGGLPDISGLTATAQAYSLYTNPALLQELAGGAPPATAGAAATTAGSGGAAFTPPAYSFNPFDEASWWTDPAALGTTVDATA